MSQQQQYHSDQSRSCSRAAAAAAARELDDAERKSHCTGAKVTLDSLHSGTLQHCSALQCKSHFATAVQCNKNHKSGITPCIPTLSNF